MDNPADIFARHRTSYVIKKFKKQTNCMFDKTEITVPENPDIVEEGVELSGEKMSNPQVVARDMAELLLDGKDPEQLIPEPLRKNAVTVEKVKKVISDGYLPPDIARAMIRAGDNQGYLDTLLAAQAAEDPMVKAKLYDTATKISKNIRQDPEIGLTAAPKTMVNIDIGSIADILDKVAKEEEGKL